MRVHDASKVNLGSQISALGFLKGQQTKKVLAGKYVLGTPITKLHKVVLIGCTLLRIGSGAAF